MRGKLKMNSNEFVIKKLFNTFLASCVKSENSEKVEKDSASKHKILEELQAVIKPPCQKPGVASVSIGEDSVGGYEGDSDSLDDDDDVIEEGNKNVFICLT